MRQLRRISTPLLHYDPLGRMIRTDLPDGTVHRISFTPWEQFAYDRNDTVMNVGDDVFKSLSTAQRRSVRSLRKQVAKHQQEIADFKANPTVRPGMENLPKEMIEAQQARRVQHLETEVQTFANNIRRILQGG